VEEEVDSKPRTRRHDIHIIGIRQMADKHELEDTAAILMKTPGGAELLEWCDGIPEFADGEVVSLVLDREGESSLSIRLERRGKSATLKFALTACD
jgi:hypothetical protein